MSTVPATKPEVAPPSPKRAGRRSPVKLGLGVLLVAALVCLLTPSIFQWGVRSAVIFLAHRHGIEVGIDSVDGNVFEPVIFQGVQVTAFSAARTSTSIKLNRADVDLSLASLIFKRGAGRVRSVSLDGLEVRVKFQPGNSGAGQIPSLHGAGQSWIEKWVPSKIDATRANLTFLRGNESVRMQNLRGLVSDREPGTLQIDRVVVNQSWLNKTFSDVKCDTAFQNSRISIANLSLEKDLTVTSASSDLAEMTNGRLKIDFDLAAFDGSMRGEMRTASASLDSPLEANGDFRQVSIPKLATFFEFSGESSGVINEGNFTFEGAWRDLQKATLKVRFDATDFQLGKRKWNSLVGGATLVENRLEISELSLKQAHNELLLKGKMTLPQPGTEWWQSEFAFDINAKIDNLTELSELLGPGFADMAGKVSVDGSIQGANQSFSGELAVAGSNLTYRTAPLDTLHASIKLEGNELQVADLELTSKGDFVRGRGVVNIIGEKRYWGELKASVAELSRYSAIMQKPIVPQPLAGGLVVDWSGDGVAKTHSGAFHAQLKKFRLVSVSEPKAHPLNADVEATYSPGNIFFSKLLVWDNNTNFTAKVTVAPKSLNLQSIRLQHDGDYWLEGDALFPFNVWSAWENASWATLLEFDSPCKFNLTGKNLDLHEAALLSGRELPVKGILDINLAAEGTPNDITTSGKVQLKKSQLALGENGVDIIGGDIGLVFADQELQIEKSQAFFNSLVFDTQGKVHLKDLHNPDFEIAVSTKNYPFAPRGDIVANADLDLDLRGASGAVTVGGSARLTEIKLPPRPDATALISGAGSINLAPSLSFDASQPPFNKWQYDVAVTTPQPVKALWQQDNHLAPENTSKYEPSGTLIANGALRGQGSTIRFSGDAVFQNVAIPSPNAQLTVNEGTLLFPDDNSPVWLTLAVSGKAPGETFTGWVYGAENAKASYFFSTPPLPQEEILDLISKGNFPQSKPLPALDTDILLHLEDFSSEGVEFISSEGK